MPDPADYGVDDKAIAIVGLGAVLPGALNPDSFWDNIVQKRSSIAEVPADRWDARDYWDPDRAAPDKSYSKIGGWVSGFSFRPAEHRIPPCVADAMDGVQQWALDASAQALLDYGHPEHALDLEHTGVILGTAIGGDRHLDTHARVAFPEFARALQEAVPFQELSEQARATIQAAWLERIRLRFPAVTEDTMPGELPNVIAGRIANVLNLRGPNFITDAACASSLAAVSAACRALTEKACAAVLSGGADRNMAASTFVKFAKIGALSATGSRPFGEGADGFVMGEGCAVFLLKRLADAEREGDRVYAVIRGIGSSSDGRGKGITAPNPRGQELAIRRAWQDAGLEPGTATLIEAHGTSTRVGDAVEFETLAKVFSDAPRGAVALGSVKGNIGHLKAAAGAAGMLKAVLALHRKTLPPTLHAEAPSSSLDIAGSPFFLNHEVRPWPRPHGHPRRAAVSSYGFGGTNFHLVLEEYVPASERPRRAVAQVPVALAARKPAPAPVLALGAGSRDALADEVRRALSRLEQGWLPNAAAPEAHVLRAPERLIVDGSDHASLLERVRRAMGALGDDAPKAWTALAGQGVFRGRGEAAGKVAFLFPGQGSQSLNMGRELAAADRTVAAVFEEADRVMKPILGRALTDFVFVDAADEQVRAAADQALTRTEVTQPAVLAMDVALMRLLGTWGIEPDMVMGHSLGEYAALVASGVMPLQDALEATAARGREMANVSVQDNGWMAAVFAPIQVVRDTLQELEGYLVIANVNSPSQSVIGGETRAVAAAIELFGRKGFRAQKLPVSHAFHTRIVAPATEPLRGILQRLRVRSPRIPIVSNVTGAFYPDAPAEIRALLESQIASPVQWVRGLQTLHASGVRTFVEAGPRAVLKGLADDLFGSDPAVVALATHHPKIGELAAFNRALCGLWARGLGATEQPAAQVQGPAPVVETAMTISSRSVSSEPVAELAEMLTRALRAAAPGGSEPRNRNEPVRGSVVVTGTGLGLPGAEKSVMDPANVQRLLAGEQMIDLLPERFRGKILAKRITRVVKGADGSGRLEVLESVADALKLGGRAGRFDLVEEYGVPEQVVQSLDTTSQLAIAAGLDALREAGIALVRTYRRTSTGSMLPDRWMLPEPLRDETGVIFASLLPGLDSFASELERYHTWRNRLAQLQMLEEAAGCCADRAAHEQLAARAQGLRDALSREPYEFDRRFLLRVIPMAHGQFAEYIGARGPNAQVNAACASSTQALCMAEDWIRDGRCRRVVVIGADNVTSDALMEWVGAGFHAMGAAATDDSAAEAALPFDRRRHGLVLGMGACGFVLESEDAVRERGMRGIAEVLATETRNSAFHPTRLDPEHIAGVMDAVVTSAEHRFGLNRHAMAHRTAFVSHETYTPARGGSAQGEVWALRKTFGPSANRVIITNTKGHTGHPMGVGIEDAIAVKILEHGVVPPVANHKEPDPELGELRLSRGGSYDVQYAMHLAAGFGSQIAFAMFRRIPGGSDRVVDRAAYQRWLADVSGHDQALLEVDRRVLRIKDAGAAKRAAVPSRWCPGTGPSVRCAWSDDAAWPQQAAVPKDSPETAAADLHALLPAEPPTSAVSASSTRSTARVASPSEPAPAAPAQPPATQQHQDDSIAKRIVQIVSRKTGYPEDMLELDLDLEADLGIDTVKQAETIGEIRKVFGIEKREDLSLRDYRTLGAVVKFVRDSTTVGAERAPSAPPAPAESEQAPDPIVARVLEIVARKTGYPEEMLALDLDLEADLGIDTVKQAETFGEIRNVFGIPRLETMNLRDYPTLARVVEFVRSHAAPAKESATRHEPQPITVAAPLDAASSAIRRVPRPVARPARELLKSTGVRLEPGVRVIMMPDRGGAGDALERALRERGVNVLRLAPGSDPAAVAKAATQWHSEGPVHGVFWLAGADEEPPIESMDASTWVECNAARARGLFACVRALYDAPPLVVAATRMGGHHGYGAGGPSAPLGGSITGLLKTYKRERPEVLVKAVDFAVQETPQSIAEALLAETLWDPSTVEVGVVEGVRYGITVIQEPADCVDSHPALARTSVFVVTGAAGGITSAITSDLAAASGATFYLLDVLEAPDPHDQEVALLRKSREVLKQHLIEAGKARKPRPTPQEIEVALLAAERRDNALRAMEAVREAGGTAEYLQVDLLDEEAVARVMQVVGAAHGRIDVLVHAAGIEISRRIQDKDQAQFDRVYGVKADGLYHLLRAAQGMPIGTVVGFSSVAGRFGNAGQSDYAAANDLLCKVLASLPRTRAGTRGIAIDWTAWDGMGMATRGSIPAMMAAAGIEMLPPQAGITAVRRELLARDPRPEVVIGGKLGVLVEELDAEGGIDAGRSSAWLREQAMPMISAVQSSPLHGPLQASVTLDPKAEPFLRDHQVEKGTAYLPGVMGIEAFAEVSRLLVPDWGIRCMRDVRFDSPVKFHRSKRRTLEITARMHAQGEASGVVHAALRSVAQPKPGVTGQPTLHFRAEVHVGPGTQSRTSRARSLPPDGRLVKREDIYRTYFHGPAYQVLERVVLAPDGACGVLASRLPDELAAPDRHTIAAPRLIELCFQTAGILEIAQTDALALPSSIDEVWLASDLTTRGKVCAWVQPCGEPACFVCEVADEDGRVLVALRGYRTIVVPRTRSAAALLESGERA